jgi:hypothetical protein
MNNLTLWLNTHLTATKVSGVQLQSPSILFLYCYVLSKKERPDTKEEGKIERKKGKRNREAG